MIFILFFAGILGLGLRLIPYLRSNFPGGSDVFFHLNKIRERSYPKGAEGMDIQFYPSGLHSIYDNLTRNLTIISEYQLLRIHLIWDFLTAILIWIILSQYLDQQVLIFTVLLFLSTPILVKQAETFSPRSIGIFFLNLTLLLAILPFPISLLGTIGYLIGPRFHRLSFQTLIFTSLFLGVLFDPIFILNMIIGLILGRILFGQHYVNLIKAHYSFILKYVKGSRYPNRPYLTALLVPSSIFTILIIFGSILNENSIFDFLPATSLFFHQQPMIIKFLLLWFLAVLFLSLFWPFGEAFRHSSLLSTPSSILVVYFSILFNFELIIIILLLLNVGLALFFIRNISSSDDLTVIGAYITETIKEQVLCAASSRRVIDYFTETIQLSYPLEKIPSEEFYNYIQENKIRFILVPTNIDLDLIDTQMTTKTWKLLEFDPEFGKTRR